MSVVTMSPPRFSLLGPLRAWAGDTELDLGPRQRRAMLALLLAKAGEPVSVPELVDLIWPHRPPPTAVNIVHRHIGELRRLFEPGLPPRAEGRWLRRHSTGYRLDGIVADGLDLHRFRELVELGRELSDVGAYAEALGLVAGRCAAGLDPRTNGHPAFISIEAEVVAAASAAARLAHTREGAALLLPALHRIADLHGFDEAAQAALVSAMGAAGRLTEALHHFDTVADRIAHTAGVAPGPDLVAARHRLLGARAKADDPLRQPPRQLPARLGGFVGRRTNLIQMDRVLEDALRTPGLLAISGMPGLGKTTLAIQWAHRVAGHFPDGQIFLNMRGYEGKEAQLRPAEAIRLLLHTLSVPLDQIPAGFAAQVGLYRSTVAGRQLLLIFDNAHDANQILDLLPGAPGCVVVVTSRNRLDDLVLRGARLADLDMFDDAEARLALLRVVGEARFTASPETCDAIVANCGGLPLAITLTGARMAAGDETQIPRDAGLHGIFAQSYRRLSVPAQRLFRLLALHGGPCLSVEAAASTISSEPAAARRLVHELAASSLIVEQYPGRFVMHDLLRAYGMELAAENESQAELAEVRARIVDHYVQNAILAAARLGERLQPDSPTALPGVVVVTQPDRKSAKRWFEGERSMLEGLVKRMAAGELPGRSWELSMAMRPYWVAASLRDHWFTAARVALGSALASGDLAGQARACAELAAASTQADPQTALRYLYWARDLLRQARRPAELAIVSMDIATMLESAGLTSEASLEWAMADEFAGRSGETPLIRLRRAARTRATAPA